MTVPNQCLPAISAHITVDGPASLGCTRGGSQPILTVTLTGTDQWERQLSSPVGISCQYRHPCCSAQFPTGQTVTFRPRLSPVVFEDWYGLQLD